MTPVRRNYIWGNSKQIQKEYVCIPISLKSHLMTAAYLCMHSVKLK